MMNLFKATPSQVRLPLVKRQRALSPLHRPVVDGALLALLVDSQPARRTLCPAVGLLSICGLLT
jgi:hypothetical protein